MTEQDSLSKKEKNDGLQALCIPNTRAFSLSVLLILLSNQGGEVIDVAPWGLASFRNPFFQEGSWPQATSGLSDLRS